jgi:hypothetical protein
MQMGCRPVAVVIMHVHKSKKFKSGGLHEKHAVATLESWKPSQHSLLDKGKPRKTCAEVAGRRTFRILTSSQQSSKGKGRLVYTEQQKNLHRRHCL